MSTLEAILFGIAQGITEFLPVSSSGHLAVLHFLFGRTPESLTFDIAVHLGTAFSVIVVYRTVLKGILNEFFNAVVSRKPNKGSQLALLVFMGSIPAGVIGVFFKSDIEALFSNMYVVVFGFIFTGLILFLTKFQKSSGELGQNFLSYDDRTSISAKQALVVGVSQALAIMPGISRSGSTIATGVLAGLSRKDAALFSFLLALPAILGASVLEAAKLKSFSVPQLWVLLVGFATSFVVGYFSLKLLLRFVQKGRVHLFSYYLWALAAVLLTYIYTKGTI